MDLFKVCAKTEEEKAHYRKQLAGDWVCQDFFAAGAEYEDVSLASIVNAINPCGALVVTHGHIRRLLTGIDGIAGNGSSLWPDRREHDPEVILVATDKNKPGVSKLKYSSVIRLGRATVPVEANVLTISNSLYEALRPNHRESYVVMSLIFRKEANLYLPHLIRNIRRWIVSGVVRPEIMLRLAAGFENPFASAAIRLAQRGFKSKRFTPRQLIMGEKVRYYYDRYRLVDVFALRANSVGAVHVCAGGTVGLTDGNTFNYSIAPGGICDVWPLKR